METPVRTYIRNSDAPTDAQSGVGRINAEEASRITRRITRISVAVAVFLIVLKFAVYHDSHSVGILSSLVHSGLDFVAAFGTFVAVRYAARAPDAQHSFGRGKAEGFIAILQACLILLVAVHLTEEAVERFLEPQALSNAGTVVVAMSFAVMVSIALIVAQGHAIAATGSVAIKGDRAHYVADMLANIAVIIGVIVTAFTPFSQADPIVAVVIALWLIWTAFKVARLSWNQLMDRELSDVDRTLIRTLVLQSPDISNIWDLRTRASGPHIHVQMHVEMDADMPLSKVHEIIDRAEHRVLTAFPAADVMIHPDPKGHVHGNRRFLRDGHDGDVCAH